MRFYLRDEILIPEPLVIDASNDQLFRIDEYDLFPQQKIDETFSYNRDLQKHMTGKRLLLEEIPFSLDVIQQHVEAGYMSYLKGVEKNGKKYFCHRCHNKDQRLFFTYLCARCQKPCTYCRKCIMMGRVSQCTPLIVWNGPNTIFHYKNPLCWEGTLSPAQTIASEKISKAIENKEELLVWAVCGAGKTEMLFHGINRALQLGLRTAIATPRTDVVFELTPRLKQAFPEVPIASLYGGSEERYHFSPLTITTTHQLLRFYRAFDVMIIDEVDAFPFSFDEMLQNAAKLAKKENGTQILLTATPKEQWQKECDQGKRNCVILPARFHRHPLPIPHFVWCGNWRKQIAKKKLPKKVIEWTKERIAKNKQCLIFFPHIELMEQALPLFQDIHPNIQSVHAEDPKRKEKVQLMRNKKIFILLTTTILERGVTFPNIDVAVVGAEDDTFTESALVQISGRVGRNPNYPNGDIIFFHHGKTRAMIRAKKQLLRMNREAKKRNLID